jgi:5-methylcytosine-specific restriction endonuclease McrA
MPTSHTINQKHDPRLDGLHGLERIQERKRIYYLENKSKISQRNSEYQKANPEGRRERWRRYYYGSSHKLKQVRGRTKEKDLQYQRDWYQENRGKRVAQIQAWQLKNPELVREMISAARRRRSYRLRGAAGSHTTREWLELKHDYDYRCLMCFRKEPEIKLTEDHKIPISKGGTNNIDNIQPLCHSCNSKKHTKTWFAFYPICFPRYAH